MAAFIGEICNKLFNSIVAEFQSNITKKGNPNMELVRLSFHIIDNWIMSSRFLLQDS